MEDRDLLLNQLSGFLMDVTVSVSNCYRPNSRPDESGFVFSPCSLSSLGRLFSDVLWKGRAVG